MGPIDYTTQVVSPFEQGLQGYKLGLGLQAMQQQRIDAENARQAKIRMQSDLAEVAGNPNAGAADYARLMTLYPEVSEHFKRGWDTLNAGQRQAALDQSSQVYAALQAKKPDVAVSLLRGWVDAAKNSGNTRMADGMEAMARMAETDPESARMAAALQLSAALGPEKFASTFDTLGKERREQQKQPAAVREAEAKATEAEAKVTPERLAADLGLTQAQTAHALAQAEKLSKEAQKVVLELAAGGPSLDAEKRFDFETKLRKEYSANTQAFQDTRDAYNRIMAAEDTGAGDIALIYSYMKILDPGSVVREGEFATASNSAGVPAAVQNIYNKAINGQRLTEEQRKTFKGQAKALLGAAEKKEKIVRGGLETVIKSYGLNAANVFADGAAPEKPAGTQASATVPSNLTPQRIEALAKRAGMTVDEFNAFLAAQQR